MFIKPLVETSKYDGFSHQKEHTRNQRLENVENTNGSESSRFGDSLLVGQYLEKGRGSAGNVVVKGATGSDL